MRGSILQKFSKLCEEPGRVGGMKNMTHQDKTDSKTEERENDRKVH